MSLFFNYIYRQISKHKILSLLVFIGILIMSGYFTSRLTFSEDITKVLPESDRIKQLNFVLDNSEFMEKLVFNISLKDSTREADPEILSRFASRFSDSIEKRFIPESILAIEKAPDEAQMMQIYDFVYEHLPVFLDEADYIEIEQRISDTGIMYNLQANLKTLISPAGFGVKKMIKNDPLHLTTIALEKFRSFQISDNFELYKNHFLTIDKRNLFLIVTPTFTNNSSVNKVLFSGIDELISDLTADDFKEIKVQYFGNAAVALGNAERIKKDIIVTVSIAVILLIILITVFFKKKRTFLVIFLPVMLGALISLAFIYFLRSNISAISLGIGSVLVGISVDYALHIFSHYRKNQDIKLLYKDIAAPIVMSSITTAAAFLCLFFINSEALNDLGLFAALSILGAAFFSLIVLPHLIKSKTKEPPKENWLDKLALYHSSKKTVIWTIIIILTIFFYFTSKKVGFDADMMKNNYMSDDLSKAEADLNRITNLSKKTIYLVSPGSTIDEALLKNENAKNQIDSLKQLGIVKSAVILNDVFKSELSQQKAIDNWNSFWNVYGGETKEKITTTGYNLGFKETAFSPFYQMLDKKYQAISIDQAELLKTYLLDNYLIETDTMTAVINIIKVDSENETITTVYESFQNDDNIWIVDKRLVTSELVKLLNRNLNQLVLISLLVVFVILLIAYGRIELTIITMIPIVISWIWTVGIMGLFGISFNIFNVIILTFIFGLGIDYSIFVMRGLIQGYKYGFKDISSYKVSVLLSVLTTILGIGVLIFAKHPALRSIATMSIIGITTVVFITFTIVPGIFNWMVSYKKGLRNRPITLLDFIFSIISLIVFIGGALLMSIFALILEIIPGNKQKKKMLFHIIFSKLTWFLIYLNFLSPKKIENPNKEDFKKPSIIIANHQSHVDLMLMMLLSPRILIVTNARNYDHPVHGKAIRYADFLPHDAGYEKLTEMAAEKVKEGYSIMIFPEGHRSDTGEIRRFHKGAFQLANTLNLDILPIIIHGQYQCLKKSEFFLKRGSLVTTILPRIDLSKNEFGSTVKEQTKGIQTYFKSEYAKVQAKLETPVYFSDFIKKNYLYKGPVLEWYTKVKIRLEKNYALFDEIIPEKANITDLGCGYGYLDYMLALTSKERSITGIDYDDGKIEIAKNCAIKNDRVRFISGDIIEMKYKESDVFILNDVLHYMPVSMQTATIEKCIKSLNTGGMIIIRDADKSLQKRHLGTVVTEIISTNLGFNKKQFNLEFVSRQMITDLAVLHQLKLEIIDQTKRTSNLIYILHK